MCEPNTVCVGEVNCTLCQDSFIRFKINRIDLIFLKGEKDWMEKYRLVMIISMLYSIIKCQQPMYNILIGDRWLFTVCEVLGMISLGGKQEMDCVQAVRRKIGMKNGSLIFINLDDFKLQNFESGDSQENYRCSSSVV